MIIADNISKKYDQLNVLNNISLQINDNEIVAITGPSGAGKSTLLHILGLLDNDFTGNLSILNTEVDKMKENQKSEFRNSNLGFIFQFHHLLPEFNAIENVALPLLLAGIKKNDAELKAINTLELVGLGERLYHKPNQLSGGEQQRVAIARAIINQPKFVFADEPTGNLDSNNAATIHKLFLELKKIGKQSFIIVTHNETLANLADRKIEMENGTIKNIVIKQQ